MRILSLDVETSPNIADLWTLWGEQHVSLEQLRQSKQIICFAAKFVGEKKVTFASTHHDGYESMVRQLWALLDETDCVLTYNGRSFDIPHCNAEFLKLGLTPPAPYKHIDLYQTVKRRFAFPSNKLQYVSDLLGTGSKVHHEGHALWVACMAGDDKAWAKMRRYNIQDIRLNEQLYQKLQPWIVNPPSIAAFSGEMVCPGCGSSDLIRKGFYVSTTTSYQKFKCRDCGRFSRSTTANRRTGITNIPD